MLSISQCVPHYGPDVAHCAHHLQQLRLVWKLWLLDHRNMCRLMPLDCTNAIMPSCTSQWTQSWTLTVISRWWTSSSSTVDGSWPRHPLSPGVVSTDRWLSVVGACSTWMYGIDSYLLLQVWSTKLVNGFCWQHLALVSVLWQNLYKCRIVWQIGHMSPTMPPFGMMSFVGAYTFCYDQYLCHIWISYLHPLWQHERQC